MGKLLLKKIFLKEINKLCNGKTVETWKHSVREFAYNGNTWQEKIGATLKTEIFLEDNTQNLIEYTRQGRRIYTGEIFEGKGFWREINIIAGNVWWRKYYRELGKGVICTKEYFRNKKTDSREKG